VSDFELLRDALTQVDALSEAFASHSVQHRTENGFHCLLFGDTRKIDRESDTETFVEPKDRQGLPARGREKCAVDSLSRSHLSKVV